MCKVNFVSEFNMLMRYAKNYGLTARERLLWIALFTIANDRATFNTQTQEFDWPEDFIPIPNGELTLQSTLDKRGIETVRNNLKQRGLIDFVPGMKNKKMPMYRLNYLSIDVGYKNVPNDVPNRVPKDDPNHVPKRVPKNAPNNDANNAPNSAPITQNKETDIKISNGRMGGVAKTPPAGRRAENTGREDFADGFVDLNSRMAGEAAFVPLPWDEAASV